MKNFIFSCVLLFFIGGITAQFPVDTQYQTIVCSPPALPLFLGTVTDNTVPDPIIITRITSPVGNYYPHHEYAKTQPWNADATIYKFYTVAIYDATTHQKIRDLPGSPLYPTYWSNTNPDILYGFKENGDIKAYSISTEDISLLSHIYFDEDSQTDYDILKLGPGEGNIDKNDHYVAFVGKKGSDMDVIIYDLQTHAVIHKKTYAGAWGNGTGMPEYVDWVSVSQSGNYVLIMWDHNTAPVSNPFNGHYGVEVYNTTDMQYLRRIVDYGNHGDFAYAQDGNEVFVQFWGPTGTLNMYYLDRMKRVVLQTHTDIGQHGHISGRNINRPGWAYATLSELNYGVTIAVKLDTSGIVEYFGHHYSSCSNYKKSPMSVPSPNGEKIMFKSDFGNSANTAEVYEFEAQKAGQANVNFENKTSIKVYPNPTNDFINIAGEKIIQKLRIINQTGQTLKTFNTLNNKQVKININDLKTGVYYILIEGDKQLGRHVFLKK